MESTAASAAPGPLHQQARQALYVLLLITAVESFIVTATSERPNVAVMGLLALLSNFFAFVWYCRDSDTLGYQRRLLLNIAVIALGPFAIAYYLVRSRPAGRRLRAVMWMLGFICLLAGASALGTVAGAVVV